MLLYEGRRGLDGRTSTFFFSDFVDFRRCALAIEALTDSHDPAATRQSVSLRCAFYSSLLGSITSIL